MATQFRHTDFLYFIMQKIKHTIGMGKIKKKLWEVSLIKYGTGVSGVMPLKIYKIGKIRGF